MKVLQSSLWPCLAIVLLLFMAFRPSETTFDKIVVREFELVDKHGTERASFTVYDEGEVVFRMMDNKGTIRIKLGAESDGSGLVLLDDNTNPGIQLLSKKTSNKITVLDRDGKPKDF